ncbi:tyrocidine synthase 3 [Kordia sp. SMS9]|uniref:non-ribosomal peptide synthetase n=1 Tax=Kordia sp. SMS9 TaxID=2282170 RepID=UPI000E0D9765|nr:non-ribosomal peptide synthetase [Kordia sp. SMS9]AXG70692.1 tyrocidine synthase 3 [Kordia sp. SMS9]
MEINKFIKSLLQKEIQIALGKEENSIRVRGNVKALTDGDKKNIAQYKAEIILFLQKNKPTESDETQQISLVPKAASYVLSSSQRRLWILSQFEGTSASYNMPNSVDVPDNINIETLKKAINAVVMRHEILRTVFREDENTGEVRQYILDNLNITVDFQDFSRELKPSEAINNYIANDAYKEFDLSVGPLVRISLLASKNDQYVLYYNMHHIISDGWSIDILARDIMLYYDFYTANTQPIPKLRIQYKEYAHWEQTQLKSKTFELHKNYWLTYLSGELPRLNLPSQQSRPPIRTVHGSKLSTYISADTVIPIREYLHANGGSLFMFLTSVFKVLCYKYTGESDVVVGTPIAGRNHKDFLDQIGFYLNILVLRNTVNPADTFNQFYDAFKDNILGAFEHQEYPFDKLVEDLAVSNDRSRNALFDAMITLHNVGEEVTNFQISEHEVDTIENHGECLSKFDIDLGFKELGDHLYFEITYNTDVYETWMIENLMIHYKELLKSIVKAPTKAISSLQYITASEEKELLYAFNDTEILSEKAATFLEVFAARVAKTPEAVAIVFNGQELTYKALDAVANQLAKYLKNNYEIVPDDLIGIKLERSEKLLISILGILKSGAAYVPMDPSYPEERIAYIEKDSKCKLTIDSEELSKFYEVQENYSQEAIITGITPTNLAYVIYTSGTTGQPKGVMIEHKSLVNFMLGMNTFFSLNESDYFLSLTSISFDISILELCWTLCNGIKVQIKNDIAALDGFDEYVEGTATMDFGLFYFSNENTKLGENKYEFLIESAKYADQHDFSSIWLPERHFHEFGGNFPNPSVLGASLATITNNINIRSGSVVLPLHDTIRVAEEWSVVDNLSNGRVSLALTSGWHINDFVLQPQNYEKRHAILFEKIEELKTLWSGEAITRINSKGNEVSIKVFPQPVQQKLPIWITAGGNPETFKKAGKIGANILTHLLGQGTDKLKENIKLYKETLTAHGHAAENAKVTLMLHTYLGEDLETVKEEVRAPFKKYLKSNLSLFENLIKQVANDVDIQDIKENNLDDLLDVGFERYWNTAALLGTKESCRKMVKTLANIGVTEIGCLIDFGVDKAKVLEGLHYLNGLRAEFENSSNTIENEKITAMQITPSYLNTLAEDENSQKFIKSLKHIIVGGESFSNTLKKKLQEKTNASLYNMYGPTETTIWSACEKIENIQGNTIGKPIANTSIYILDEQLQICPKGIVGKLYIGGKGVARGYLNNPELTAEKFIPSPFAKDERIYTTGDMARWLPNGTLEFFGRKDNQVKLNGYRIELGEIENVLEAHDTVYKAVVIVKNTDSGKSLVAYIVLNSTSDIDETLRSYLHSKLPHYMIPGSFVELTEIPLTANGKVDRKQLEKLDSPTLKEAQFVAPQNVTEEKIVNIWSAILNIAPETISTTTNFFTLGGDSLKSIGILRNYHKEFGIRIKLKEIYLHTTIRSHVDLIEGKEKETYTAIPKLAEANSYPLSSAQHRLWVLSQFKEGLIAYNEPANIPLTGTYDIELFRKSLDAAIERHEILRTVFKENEQGDLQQWILSKEALGFQITYKDFSQTENAEALAIAYTEKDAYEPFNLETGPLFRVSLLKLTQDQYIFYFNLHHIISDGWSKRILSRDILAFYEAFQQETQPVLPALHIQYKEYASWQLAQMKLPEQEAHKMYWLQTLAGELPVSNLPSQKIRPEVKTYNGVNLQTYISSTNTTALKQYCQEHGGSLFMGLLSCFHVLLHRYTTQEDFVIGTPVAGRNHAELENQIGVYINTLVLRNQVTATDTFEELFTRVKEKALTAYEHQTYSFDTLVENLSLKRDMSRSAVFDIMFMLQNIGKKVTEFELPKNGDIEIINNGVKMSKFDLELSFNELGDCLSFDITYNTDIYEEWMVSGLMQHFKQLLAELLQNPTQSIENIHYLSDKEQEQLLNEFNTQEVAYPKEKTILEIFETQVQQTPKNVAIVFEGKECTYADVDEKANQLAQYIKTNYAIVPDDLIGIKLAPSEWLVISILAVLKSGGAYVPIDPNYPQERINYIENDSKCKVTIDEKELARFKNEKHAYATSKVETTLKPNNLAYIIYTSGTTGNPKGVMIEHRNVVRLFFTETPLFHFNQHDTWTLFHSYCFDFSVWELFGALLHGGKLIIVPKSVTRSPQDFYTLLVQEKVTVLNQTPTAFKGLSEVAVTSFDKEMHLRYIIFGGEALYPKQLEKWHQKYPAVQLVNMYGITETTVHATYKEIGSTEIKTGLSNIGTSIPTLTSYILDDNMALVPLGVIGELCIGGAGLARGYLHREKLTEEKFVTNIHGDQKRLYKSGDLARRLPNGNIEYLGRKDDQVKIRGHRIELGEITNQLLSKNDLENAVVLTRVNTDGNNELVAFITSETPQEGKMLKEYLSKKLPDYMVPRIFIQVAKIPVTANGKTDKTTLFTTQGEVLSNTVSYVAPTNEIEEEIVKIWAKVLHFEVEKIGIHDNFFDLGGDSLKSVKLLNLVNMKFNLTMRIEEVFNKTDVKSFSLLIKHKVWLSEKEEENPNEEENYII